MRALVRLVVIVLVLVVVGVLLLPRLARGQPVDTAVARRDRISAFIEERAKTRLPSTVRIAMPVEGRILPIELTEGDVVRAGQVVARIEAADLDTAVARAEARVRGLQAEIVKGNDVRLEHSTLEELENFLESVNRAVEAAEAETESSRARQDYRSTDHERKEKAFAEEAATLKELDEARLAHIESRVQFRTDVLNLRGLEAIRKAAQIWPRAVREFIEKKALTEAVLRQELAEAEAALAQARRDRERATITAPADGVVLDRVVWSRRMLSAGDLLLEVGDLSRLEIEAEVLSTDAVRLAVGDRVEVFGPSIGSRIVEGTLQRVEPQGFTKVSSLGVEQQRVRVVIGFAPGVLEALAEEGRSLGVGFRLGVRIITGTEEDTLVIPRSALFRGASDRWQVFAVRGGRARLVDIEVGLMNDRMIEVRDGLAAGDEVILAPERALGDGSRVSSRSP